MKKNNKAAGDRDLILHGVKITHPDRVIFEERITKGDVARYYAAVAPFLLREINNRPISLLRCPSGIKADCFYQRNVGFGLGTNVHPFLWKYKGRKYKYIYVKDEKGIMEMIQMGVIEVHPWGATIDKIHTPDRMIFDLDPEQGLLRARSRGDSEDRYERKGLDFHRRLRRGFLDILEREPARCRIVDAGRPLADVSDQVWSIVSERL